MNWLRRLQAWLHSKVRDPEMPEAVAPAWLERIANDFVELHPGATLGEWHRFSVLHAGNAFADGFRAGWEAKEYGPQPDVVFVNERGTPNVTR